MNTALHRLGRLPEKYGETRACQDGVLEELLHGVSVYGDHAPYPSVPCNREQISWSALAGRPVDVISLAGSLEEE
eukprot:1410982-Pyramimonas_sp.AAC.1